MSERIWDRYLTANDRELNTASGFGALMGLGQRPALLVVDANYNFCGDRPEPVIESIKRWPTSCGAHAWQAMKAIRRLLDICHEQGLPVFYSTNTRRPDGFDAGSWRFKLQARKRIENHDLTIRGNQIVAELAPQPQDIIITKTKPSVFFSTPFLSFLTDLKVDSLVVCGGSTSGCVRATVVDAFSANLRCMVVEDACFDRTEAAHALNLFDLHAKYADVVDLAYAESELRRFPQGLFALPGAR
jgi:nicotinamidase-related amidase